MCYYVVNPLRRVDLFTIITRRLFTGILCSLIVRCRFFLPLLRLLRLVLTRGRQLWHLLAGVLWLKPIPNGHVKVTFPACDKTNLTLEVVGALPGSLEVPDHQRLASSRNGHICAR